jgi:hypothetical protein
MIDFGFGARVVKFWRRRKTRSRRGGCAFFLWTCLYFWLFCVSSCLFLLLNSALIKGFYGQFALQGPDFLLRPRVVQAVMFIGPVLMIFVEWWVIDLVVDLVTPKRDIDDLAREHDEMRG